MPATDGQKRKKTSGTSTSSGSTTPSVPTPKDHAKAAVSTYLASLPKAIALVGNSVFNRHLELLITIDRTKRRINNLTQNSENKFPVSMRFKFELSTIAALKDKQEFKQLATGCQSDIHYCQATLREKCKQAVELELAYYKNELKLLFCETIYLLATAFVLNHDNSIDHTDATILSLIACSISRELDTALRVLHPDLPPPREDDDMSDTSDDDNDNDDNDTVRTAPSKLFKHSGFKSVCRNRTCHIAFYALLASSNDTSAVPTRNYDLVEPILSSFTETATMIFYTGYTTYAEAMAYRESEKALLAWAESAMNVTATQATADITTTANLTSPQLADLIETKVNEKTKKLTIELERLKRLSHKQLKDQAAPRKGGRANNNNNNKTNAKANAKTPRKTGNNNNGQKADAAANASTNANNRRRNQRRGRNNNGN